MTETRLLVSAVRRKLFFMACFFLAIWGNSVLDTNAVLNNGEEMIQVQGMCKFSTACWNTGTFPS